MKTRNRNLSEVKEEMNKKLYLLKNDLKEKKDQNCKNLNELRKQFINRDSQRENFYEGLPD